MPPTLVVRLPSLCSQWWLSPPTHPQAEASFRIARKPYTGAGKWWSGTRARDYTFSMNPKRYAHLQDDGRRVPVHPHVQVLRGVPVLLHEAGGRKGLQGAHGKEGTRTAYESARRRTGPANADEAHGDKVGCCGVLCTEQHTTPVAPSVGFATSTTNTECRTADGQRPVRMPSATLLHDAHATLVHGACVHDSQCLGMALSSQQPFLPGSP